MNNLPLFLKWGEQSLIPHLYEQDWYNGDKVKNRTGFTSGRVNKRLGRMRLRQARIQNGELLLTLQYQAEYEEDRTISPRHLLISLIPLVITSHHLSIFPKFLLLPKKSELPKFWGSCSLHPPPHCPYAYVFFCLL